ncbi:MAG: AI-2E family transporter [Chloroflexota bacterium]
MLERNAWFRALIILLVIAVALHIGGLLWDLALRFGDIIMLFTAAWIVAFVLRPLVRLFNVKLPLPWWLAVGVVYLLFFAFVVSLGVLLIPALVSQVADLAVKVPAWVALLPAWYQSVQGHLPEQVRVENLPSVFNQRDILTQLQQIATTLLQSAIVWLTGIASALFGLIFVLIMSFYLALDGDRIAESVLQLVPDDYKEGVYFLIESVDRSFGGFLRGQGLQAVISATGTALTMGAFGVPYIVLGTTIAALAMIVPFVGPFLAIAPPVIFAGLDGSLSKVVGVTIVLLILQQVVFNVVAPKLMSQAVGIHPLLVFLALLVGSKVAGVAGAILGVPVVAVIAAMAGFFYQRNRPATETVTPGVSDGTGVVLRHSGLPPGRIHRAWSAFFAGLTGRWNH